MSALTQDRNTPQRDGVDFIFPVAASTRIYAGALVALNANGYAVPGSAATDLASVGIAQEQANNIGGTNGDLYINVRRGCFALDNSVSTDALTRADIGKTCYIVDDHTVAKTASGKSAASIVRDVDADGV
jgi:hypothetical protein